MPKLLVFKDRLHDEQIDKIKVLLFLFIRDFHTELDIHLKHLYYSFKKYVWSADYQFAYNCFVGLLLYAEFNKKHPRHFQYSEEQLIEIQAEEEKILDFIENNSDEYEFSDLSYSKYSYWDIDKATHIFPIYKEYNFSYSYLKAVFNAQIESYSLEEDGYRSTNYYKIGLTIRETIIDFLFEIPFNKNTNSFFEFIIDIGVNYDSSKRSSHDAIEYIEKVIEWFYYKVDSNHGSEVILNNFWNFWDTIYSKLSSGKHLFNKEFLFDGNWKPEAEDWFVLKHENRADIYLKKLSKLDYINIKALMQLLSGIGFQSLNPQGIKILAKHLKSDTKQLLRVNYYYGEKLIMRCFKNKLKEIKEDDSLLEEFLWFLNLMIDLGSSNAYYIRENLILYKK